MRATSLLLGLVAAVVAQRPADTSICDYYTTALLMENSAANQYMLLTLVVNTVIIGNYTQPNVGIAVPGILVPGMYNGTAVNLLPYFDGSLASANTGGNSGTPQNFLDDGGAAPLMKNMPSNGNMGSNQYLLVTHLYEYFGVLLGCTMVGQTGFPKYSGSNSMGDVHRFMDLNPSQLGYFITQVGLSAASFGVTTDDVTAVGMALNSLFGFKCAPDAMVVPNTPASPQAICQDDSCPQAPSPNCSAYGKAVAPMSATVSSMGATATSSASPSASGASKPSEGTMAQAYSFLGTLLAALGFAVML